MSKKEKVGRGGMKRKSGGSSQRTADDAMVDAYIGDPQPGDESDPAYREEMFETFKALDWTPDDITTDPKMKAEYAEWLKTHQE